VRIRLFGVGAHGSMPQKSIDPVVMASALVMRLQTIVSREIAPGEMAVVTVGAITSGTRYNIISRCGGTRTQYSYLQRRGLSTHLLRAHPHGAG
jgi:metal-dependent amidase/aminoacylase/carboxypeptidase family protein